MVPVSYCISQRRLDSKGQKSTHTSSDNTGDLERQWCISQDPIKGSISVPSGDRNGNWVGGEEVAPVSILFIVYFSLLLHSLLHGTASSVDFCLSSSLVISACRSTL